MGGTVGRRGRPLAGSLSIGGGLLLAIGSFLTWAEVSGGGTRGSATGVDGSDGWITLVAGAVVFAVGVAFARGRGRRGLATVAILAALIGGGLGLYDALTAEDRVLGAVAASLADRLDATAEEVRGILDEAVAAGELGISIGLGLLLVIGGGALGLVGGSLGLARRPAAVDEPPPPPLG